MKNDEIKFNIPPVFGTEKDYLCDAITRNHLCGDGYYGKKCQAWFEETTKCKKALLTPNCTQALEMAAIILNIKEGDEVIMPSYTFVSTANAFVARGAKIIFVDIRPDTMNIDESKIEDAITPKTKGICVVHYAGVACEMDEVMRISKKHNIPVVEDAAQAMMSTYKGQVLGTIGCLGTYSFHETKNYTSGGEGGVLLVNDESFVQKAEVIREKGTNRSAFFRGMVDKYQWVDFGSSYLPSELQAAFLWGQLEASKEINLNRLNTWSKYYKELSDLSSIELPTIPKDCEQNAHMFYIKVKTLDVRQKLMKFLANEGVKTAFHYVPLHSSLAGKKFGIMSGEDRFTTLESDRLLRLPMWYNLSTDKVERVCSLVKQFFKENI